MPAQPPQQLYIPHINPNTPQEHSNNLRSIQDWANRLNSQAIYSQILTAAATPSVTFAIPQQYNFGQLHIVVAAASTNAGILDLGMRFNNDAGANYFTSLMYEQNGGAPAGFAVNAGNNFRVGQCSSTGVSQASLVSMYINDPLGSSFRKVVVYNSILFDATIQVECGGGLWANTSPIRLITLFVIGGIASFRAGTSIRCYGVW